jgi:hypothetical protein
MPDIVFFTLGGMPTRAEKDYAASLGGTVAFRDYQAATLEHDRAAKYIGYIPEAFLHEPGIIKDFNKVAVPYSEPVAPAKKAKGVVDS